MRNARPAGEGCAAGEGVGARALRAARVLVSVGKRRVGPDANRLLQLRELAAKSQAARAHMCRRHSSRQIYTVLMMQSNMCSHNIQEAQRWRRMAMPAGPCGSGGSVPDAPSSQRAARPSSHELMHTAPPLGPPGGGPNCGHGCRCPGAAAGGTMPHGAHPCCYTRGARLRALPGLSGYEPKKRNPHKTPRARHCDGQAQQQASIAFLAHRSRACTCCLLLLLTGAKKRIERGRACMPYACRWLGRGVVFSTRPLPSLALSPVPAE